MGNTFDSWKTFDTLQIQGELLLKKRIKEQSRSCLAAPSNPSVFPLYRRRNVPAHPAIPPHTTRIRWRDWIGDF